MNKYVVLNNESKCFAGIVTFNPDVVRLKQNIDAIYPQVEKVIIFDNGSSNISEIKELLENYRQIKTIFCDKNIGIAAGLNRIFEYSKATGAAFVLTLDQDSISPKGLLDDYRAESRPNVGIYTPMILDLNLHDTYSHSENPVDEVDKCITSAALTSVLAWQDVNGFDETMFIDCVDFDFCDRIRKAGYKILRVNEAVLRHEIGSITVHHIGHIKVVVKNHSAFRKYYIARNTVYMARKHGRMQVVKAILQVFKQVMLVLFFEEEKSTKIKRLFDGLCDGIKVPVPDKWKLKAHGE